MTDSRPRIIKFGIKADQFPAFIHRRSKTCPPITPDYLASVDGIYFWPNPADAIGLWECLCQELKTYLAAQKFGHDVRLISYACAQSQFKEKARPTAIFVNSDIKAALSAKASCKDILRQPEFCCFRSMAMSFDPGHMSLAQPLATHRDVERFTHFPTTNFTFWKSVDKNEYLISDLAGLRGRSATLSGPVQIKGESYFFTSAHILNNESPFDTHGARAGSNSIKIALDSALDEIDDPSADELSLDNTNNCSAEVLAPERASSKTDAHAASSIFVVSAMSDDPNTTAQMSINQGTSLFDELNEKPVGNQREMSQESTSELSEMQWPTSSLEVLIGSYSLDYALIRVPEQLYDKISGTYVCDFEARALAYDAAQVPSGSVSVCVTGRPALTGSFEPQSMGIYSSRSRSAHNLWTYLPGDAEIFAGPSGNGVRPGDSGALVFDKAKKKLYGHVIAGVPSKGTAYVVPSQSVLADIHQLLISINSSFSPDAVYVLGFQLHENLNARTERPHEDLACVQAPSSSSSEESRSVTPDASTACLTQDFREQTAISAGTESSVTEKSANIEWTDSEVLSHSKDRTITLSSIDKRTLYPSLGKHDETRIVLINPFNNDDDRVCCSTKPVTDLSLLPYCAVSYFKESGLNQRCIELNGCIIHVDSRVEEAIRFLRTQGETVLWIDVLCVDETNAQEIKNHVQRLREIYAGAKYVAAWPSIESTLREPADLRRLARCFHMLDEKPLNVDLLTICPKEFFSFCSDDLWSQARRVLEFCAAREVIVMCVSGKVDFDRLVSNVKQLSEHLNIQYIVRDGSLNRLDCIYRLRKQRLQFRSGVSASDVSLFEIFMLTRHFRFESKQERAAITKEILNHGVRMLGKDRSDINEEYCSMSFARNLLDVYKYTSTILLCRATVPIADYSSASMTRNKRIVLRTQGFASSQDIRLNLGLDPTVQLATDPKRPSWVPRWSELDLANVPPWILYSIRPDSDWAHWRFERDDKTADADESIWRRKGTILHEIQTISSALEANDNRIYRSDSFTDRLPPSLRMKLLEDCQTQMELNRSRRRGPVALPGGLDVVEELWLTLIAPLMRAWFGEVDGKEQGPRELERTIRGMDVSIVAEACLTSRTCTTFDWIVHNRHIHMRNMPLGFWIEIAARNRDHLKDVAGATMWKKEACEAVLSAAIEYMNHHGLRLACTTDQALRLVYHRAQKGDHICHIDGCPLPVILRPFPSTSTHNLMSPDSLEWRNVVASCRVIMLSVEQRLSAAEIAHVSSVTTTPGSFQGRSTRELYRSIMVRIENSWSTAEASRASGSTITPTSPEQGSALAAERALMQSVGTCLRIAEAAQGFRPATRYQYVGEVFLDSVENPDHEAMRVSFGLEKTFLTQMVDLCIV